MNQPDSLQLDENLARLLAAYDQGIEGGDALAQTVGVQPLAAGASSGERRGGPLSASGPNQGSLGEVLPDNEATSSPWTPPAPPPTSPSHRVGRFELRKQLGKGGCGIVFLAYDPKLEREVALKIPRPEMLMSSDARRRLVREALAAAEFDHPNLVPVYETGEIGPICFIATAFCPGVTLGEWLDKQAFQVPLRQAARLVATVAEAVQHAHDRGVLHRDLKPNNVILQALKEDPNEQEPPPGSCQLRGEHFIPRVVDFGLAKLMERGGPSETTSRQILGTPKYMAPEQAQARHDDIGPPADVYALGVIFYELITGRAPYDGATDVEVLRQAIDGKLTAPRHIRPDVPRDLEAICLKAMAKLPARRYRTAIDLADDLRRFLDGKPTLARPLNWFGRAARWLRRNDQAVALAVLTTIASALLAVWIMNTYQARQLKSDRETALREQAERTRLDQQREYAQFLRTGYQAWRAGDAVAAATALESARRIARTGGEPTDFVHGYLTNLLAAEQRAIVCPAGPVTALAVSPDGTRIASGHPDGTVCVWNRTTGEELASLKLDTEPITWLTFLEPGVLALGNQLGRTGAWSILTGELRARPSPAATIIHPSGKSLTANHGTTVFTAGEDGVIRIWDATAARPEARRLPAPATALGVHPDGLTFTLAVGKATVIPYIGRDAQPATVVPKGVFGAIRVPREGPALGIVLGEGVAIGYELHAGGPREVFRLSLPDGATPTCAEFSGDDSRLAIGDNRGRVSTWAMGEQRTPQLPPSVVQTGLDGPVLRVALSHDGKILAAPGARGLAIWAIGETAPSVTIPGHAQSVFCFLPGGARLVTGEPGGTVRVWSTGTGLEERALFGHVGRVTALGISPDGRCLVSAAATGEVRCWDVRTGQELLTLRQHSEPVTLIAFASNGKFLVTAGSQFAVWETRE